MASDNRQRDNLRDIIGMQLGDGAPERFKAACRRFDDEQRLPCLVHFPFPSEQRGDARQHVDAGGQSAFHERFGDSATRPRGWTRHQHDDVSLPSTFHHSATELTPC